MAGATNHDRKRFVPHVDVEWDLEDECWPDQLQAYEEIHARDVLEHISPGKFYQVMDNIWLLLVENGLLHLQVPEAGSENAIIDPTHWRGFHLQSFDYLDPRTRLGRACWTTRRRWWVEDRRRVRGSNTNLRFRLRKIYVD